MPPMMPPGMPGMPGGMPPGMQPGMTGPGGMPQPGVSGPNKTVMLQPSDGIVSVARTGGQLPAAAGPVTQGATTLYWIVCLVAGVLVGVLAYVLVRHL